MGKQVIASDFLNFPAVLASATVVNNRHRIDVDAMKQLLAVRRNGPHFIARTFGGVFYEDRDLQFLDRVSANIENLKHPHPAFLGEGRFDPLVLEEAASGRLYDFRGFIAR